MYDIRALPPDRDALGGQRYQTALHCLSLAAIWICRVYFCFRLLFLVCYESTWWMWVTLAVEGIFAYTPYLEQCLVASTKAPPREKLRIHGETVPRVDILLPCCGEDEEIILQTVTAACSIDYPRSSFRVRVLDDGESKILCERVKALREEKYPHLSYHTRGKQSGKVFAKAGNINFALSELERGEKDDQPVFCAILDADSVPCPDFLRATIPHLLRDESVSLVTTRQYFSNLPDGDRLSQSRSHFYTVINSALDRAGQAIDSGSGAVFRRQAILEAGGYPTFSFSEDWQLSLVLRGHDRRIVQVDEQLQHGLVPSSLRGHIAQRNRWMIGHSQQVFALKEGHIPRKIQWMIVRDGLFIVWGLLSSFLGFVLLPVLAVSASLSLPFPPWMSALSLLYVAVQWGYEHLQAACAGCAPFASWENRWMAGMNLLAIARFHLSSHRPKSFVTGSNNHSEEDSWSQWLFGHGMIYNVAILVAILSALVIYRVDNWVLLHLCYLTIKNHWVPLAYLLRQ
ncbi:hypothetical protein ASPZODRAFT_102882 [Penicilliopsis zonata CBS 506.65]|uniref:Glycosyltransferase 2-like domain-containing protein n=1 Tax=Penicilliopsis zonata CBS 506.65 TaxID=1073090 RepID=A0A1L9S8Q1_9EURO|nr:hypothetical protein ASPZODRAFT_102882 [Penicilliopsis zonata CBS 506.65]OJJ43533.1 hypothetical protein ASPZODRAFT_102882 [Penicilliopsis zonata CBS 506.65]